LMFHVSPILLGFFTPWSVDWHPRLVTSLGFAGGTSLVEPFLWMFDVIPALYTSPAFCPYRETVDGRNPAPVDRWLIPLFIGLQPSFWWCRISSIHRMIPILLGTSPLSVDSIDIWIYLI
jgi:hypothetical protein